MEGSAHGVGLHRGSVVNFPGFPGIFDCFDSENQWDGIVVLYLSEITQRDIKPERKAAQTAHTHTTHTHVCDTQHTHMHITDT